MINPKYYFDKDFRAQAFLWWRSLSTNEQKAYEKALPCIFTDGALASEIAEIYDNEIIKKGVETGTVIVARWETKGHDWLELRHDTSEKIGKHYSYSGKGCGGGLPLCIKTDDEAIRWMDNPWGHHLGTGACTVLRSDRPSLRRVK